jgi:PAS domain S-box-containing protein
MSVFDSLQVASCRILPVFPSRIIFPCTDIEKITGYNAEVLAVSGVYETYIHPSDLSPREIAIHHAIWNSDSYTAEYQFRHGDGTLHRFIEKGKACTSCGDVWIDLTIIDVTPLANHLESLEQEKYLLKQAFDAIPDPIAVMDPNYCILQVNPAMASLMGSSPEKCIGQSCNSPLPESDCLSSTSPSFLYMLDLKTQRQEVFEPRMGATFQVTTSLLPDGQGNLLGCLYTAHDISETKKNEQHLLHSLSQVKEKSEEINSTITVLNGVKDELKEEIGKRTSEVEQLSGKLQEQHRFIEQLLAQKELFITQLAHDLRTPLTPVIAMLPLLSEGIADPDSKELLSIFQTSIEYLQKMVDGIIQYANLNHMSGIEDYEIFDLSDLISASLKQHSFLLIQKEITVIEDIPEGISVMLSKSQAPVLFRNLITNSIQFNAYRGKIFIHGDIQNDWITLSFTDTGVGIPRDMLITMWDEFSTGDTSRRDPLSKGLGLPLVKQIVNLHGGSINGISDGIGTGATFTLTLPRYPGNQRIGREICTET